MILRVIPALAAAFLATLSLAAYANPPVIESFNASLSNQNKITFSWKINNPPSSNLAYIAKRGTGKDVGFVVATCPGSEPAVCSTSIRVPLGQRYKYTLKVSTDENEDKSYATTELNVPALERPESTQKRVSVNFFNVQPQILSWSHTGTGYIEVTPPGSICPISQQPGSWGGCPTPEQFPATGSYTIPMSTLKVGKNTYNIAYCEQPSVGGTPLCSGKTPVSFVVEPARFNGPQREFVNAGQSTTLTWTGTGDLWHISIPALNVSKFIAQPHYTIPAGQLTDGVYEVSLNSCNDIFGDGGCSNRVNIVADTVGTVSFTQASNDPVADGDIVANIAPDSGSEIDHKKSTRNGTFYQNVSDNTHVQTGDIIGIVISNSSKYVDHHEIIAGQQQVANWTTKPWSQDYTAITHKVNIYPDLGQPLDITFDTTGQIWSIGEFSTAFATIKQGTVKSYIVPLKRYLDPSDNLGKRVTPFATAIFGCCAPAAFSGLGERIIPFGSRIWFTQSGTLFAPGFQNHSRIVSFNPNAKDKTTTRQDDRFCAIHVPGNNNAVLGIAGDSAHHRLWIAEPRFTQTHGAIGWFKPSQFTGSCNNLLDYNDPDGAVEAASNANLCTPSHQQGCIHILDMPSVPDGDSIRPEHLEIDSQGNVWFTAVTAQVSEPDRAGVTSQLSFLGVYNVASGQFSFFPLPPSHEENSLFNGYPWQLRVNQNAVYIGEYGDVALLRFDRNHPKLDDCESLVNGKNPCISQIYLPRVWRGINLHSIALRGNRLWFTLANEQTNPPTGLDASTFGYINTTSWANGQPTGVIYSDLSGLGDRQPGQHHSFRGIEVSPRGDIALSDMGQYEIDRLSHIP